MRQLASNVIPVYDSHVAGHSGVLGNEIVDLLAKRATKCVHNDSARVLPVWPAMLMRHQLKEWAWITASAFPDLPTLYAFESEAFRLQRDDRPAPPPPAPGFVTTQPEPVRLCLKMMSYNTLTLLDGETARTAASAGMKVYGRRDVIKEQLQRERVGLVGLQETRLHQSQIAPDLHFHMLHASATPAGTHGVALWVAKDVPLARRATEDIYVRTQDLTVLSESPRHLFARISASLFDLMVLVAHAPYDVPGCCAADNFWSEMAAGLAQPGNAGPLIVLTDANARVGSVLSSAIGEVDPEQESPARSAFHNFLLQHGLCLPSTFPACHSGPSSTWTSPHGKHGRLDYIAVPEEWISASTSNVWVSFESLQQREDHRPVVVVSTLQRQLTVEPFVSAPRRSAMRPDEQWTSACKELLLEGFCAAPSIPWQVDVDAHFDGWVQNWRFSWDSVQDQTQPRATQQYITSTTLTTIQFRKALRIYIHEE